MIYSKLNPREKQVFFCIASLVVIISGLLFWHFNNSNNSSETIITVTRQPSNNLLYFNGTVAPADIYPVTSIVDGVVDKKLFNYGQQVKANDILFHIYSPKVEDDYRSAEVNYLKAQQSYQDIQNWQNSTDVINARRALDTAKNSYNNSQRQFNEATQLKKLGYISSDEFYSDQSQYQSSLNSYQQAQDSLTETIKKGQGINADIAKLTLQQAQTTLQEVQHQLVALDVKAPQSGIALFPEKSSDSSSDTATTTQLYVGSQIKVGDTLVAIGNLKSISVQVKVNEVSVNQIKPGAYITLTGIAFPGITLNGKVTSVDAQASSSGNDLPTFTVHIEAPDLTQAQRQIIRVGMSTTVALDLGGKPSILIPINAVIQNGDQTLVKRVGQFGKITEVSVVTGETSQDNVEIKQGLNPGDKIMVGSS